MTGVLCLVDLSIVPKISSFRYDLVTFTFSSIATLWYLTVLFHGIDLSKTMISSLDGNGDLRLPFTSKAWFYTRWWQSSSRCTIPIWRLLSRVHFWWRPPCYRSRLRWRCHLRIEPGWYICLLALAYRLCTCWRTMVTDIEFDAPDLLVLGYV